MAAAPGAGGIGKAVKYWSVPVPRRLRMRRDRRCNRDVIILLLLMASRTRPASIVPRALGACTAVTADDLQRTLGISFRRGQESSAGKQSTCDYAIGNAQVSVTIQRLDGAVDIAAEMEAMKREMPGVTVRRLGEASFIVEIPGAGAQVHAVHEHESLMVSILGLGDGAAISEAAEQLARTARGRM